MYFVKMFLSQLSEYRALLQQQSARNCPDLPQDHRSFVRVWSLEMLDIDTALSPSWVETP